MDERITCSNCGKKCTPRLWHIKGGIFFSKKIQHLCPYCGTVMYVTGGGRAVGFFMLLGIVFTIMFSSLISFINKDAEHQNRLIYQVQSLEDKVDKYRSDIAKLVKKTEDGKNPQLLRSLKVKSEKLKKLELQLLDKKGKLVLVSENR